MEPRESRVAHGLIVYRLESFFKRKRSEAASPDGLSLELLLVLIQNAFVPLRNYSSGLEKSVASLLSKYPTDLLNLNQSLCSGLPIAGA